MKPLFGGFLVSVLYNRSSAVFGAVAMHRAIAHADVGRFPCLWGLRMVVKNIQNVKSEVK